MNVQRHRDSTRQGHLRVFQANVGKKGETHDVALNLAWRSDYDVVLIQEPWTSIIQRQESQCVVKTHRGYNTWTPVTYWEDRSTRPRVLTYTRKDATYSVEQVAAFQSRDALWLQVGTTTIVNIYRQPGDNTMLDQLLRWTPPPRCMVAGDFNASHGAWGARRSADGGARVMDWADAHQLMLLNPPDAPTRGRNTLDLAFSNLALAESTVEAHLYTSSDHETLSTTLPFHTQKREVQRKPRVTTPEQLDRCKTLIQNGMHRLPTALETEEQIEAAAAAIQTLYKDSIAIANPRRGANSYSCTPWWTDECQTAQEYLTALRRAGQCELAQEARQKLRTVARTTKRDFWRRITDSAKSPNDVYRLCRWASGKSQFNPPPLHVDGQVYETQTDRARALRKALLEGKKEEADIDDPWLPLDIEPPTIQVDLTVSLEQARDAVTCTGNTTPGADGITVLALQTTWEHTGEYIRALFEACLQLGYHPKVFREAEVVMIPKPGKRDLTIPKAWRPISLLPCLGKGLERLLARRMATAAVQAGVVPRRQFGALPKRSAVDLAGAATHFIEQALNKGMCVTSVAVDVAGAFNALLRNRTVLGMRKQGWPTPYVKWAYSFMSDRSACVRLQQAIIETVTIGNLLPQGSPASPIVFLLALAPALTPPKPLDLSQINPRFRHLFDITALKGRFGYADDINLLNAGRTLEQTCRAANEDVEKLIQWGTENGITFDSAKTEVMHFYRGRDKREAPDIRHGQVVVPPAADSVRWLGIHFDRRLSFDQHIQKWINKSKRVTGMLCGLSQTGRGLAPHLARRAVQACTIPVLFYGAEVWYPRRRTIAVQKKITDKLNAALRCAMKAVLPIWRTFPTSAMHREAGIPPAEIILQQIQQRQAVRLGTLDECHPLVQALAETPKGFSRLHTTADLVESFPRPKLLLRQPKAPSPTQGVDKVTAAKNFQQWLKGLPPEAVVVYSDGSQLEGATAWGYVVYRSGRIIAARGRRMGAAEVFDAEATGALEGLERALSLVHEQEDIHVCLDNTSAIAAFQGRHAESSQAVFLRFKELAQAHGRVTIRWCPGHQGIKGNELADEIAKAACKQQQTLNIPATLAAVRRRAKEASRRLPQLWWREHRPETYQHLDLDYCIVPGELQLSRSTLHHLLAARSGHGNFAAYYERFNITEADLLCRCGWRTSTTHIFRCREMPKRSRAVLRAPGLHGIFLALGSDWQTFARLVETAPAHLLGGPRRQVH
jgi:ribonuclease HI